MPYHWAMRLAIYQVDAFASQVFVGNPAAVCPLEEWLPDGVLQSIAQENNLAETAFFVPNKDKIHIRWFTPTTEVNLCGHATLATAFILFEKLGFEGEAITFESRSGDLSVSRDHQSLVLDFPSQPGTPCEIPTALVEGLGREPVEVLAGKSYLAVLESEEDVLGVDPELAMLRQLHPKEVIVTAEGRECDFVSRYFAPSFGIDEDPVTGSAHCMLTPYWANKLNKAKLTARQLSQRTGELVCELKEDRVLISGKAVLYLEGTIWVDG